MSLVPCNACGNHPCTCRILPVPPLFHGHPFIADDPSVRSLETRLAEVEARLQDMKQRGEVSDVIVEMKIAGLEDRLATLTRSIRSAAKSEAPRKSRSPRRSRTPKSTAGTSKPAPRPKRRSR